MSFASESRVEVIVPARNEEDCIATCLESLVSQREACQKEARQQGIPFRITVVDDGSTDRTRAIAESFPGVRVIGSEEAVAGATGKCNALVCGARGSQAEWLLFTDADTSHYPGSLAVAVREGEERKVDLLSFSPEQETASWSERALMPVVFAELARTYPTERINDPADPAVAANGQYILVRRAVYEQLGGHRAVANKVLEDVELARLFKSSGHPIWFRHGAGLVKTRMYRNFGAMLEGWTKNLSLLFRHPIRLAMIRTLEFTLIWATAVSGLMLMMQHHWAAGVSCLLACALLYGNFLVRILAAHFPWSANLAALWGLPLFSFLLLRSYLHSNIRGAVKWKGRIYPHPAPSSSVDSSR